VAEALQASRGQPTYAFVLKNPKLGAEQASDTPVYIFSAFDAEALDELGERVDECELDDYTSVLGFVVSASREGREGSSRTRLMTRDDGPLLQQICRGLRQPLASAMGGNQQEDDDITVFDFLSRFTDQIRITLLPGRMMDQDLEAGLIGHYWVGVLQTRYARLPGIDLESDPAAYQQFLKILKGGTAEFRFPLSEAFTTSSTFPPQARDEFGGRVDRLAADWTVYLARAAVTLRGERHPVLQNGRFATILPRFSVAEVGSPQFWRAANDMRMLAEQLHCMTDHFLSERGYVAPEEARGSGQCGLDEIRLPAR
jgi:hypothetical protein